MERPGNKNDTEQQGMSTDSRRDSSNAIDKSRRKFTTAGLTSPVIMSLFSQPAWSAVACSPSGLVSGNVSGQGAEPIDCTGRGRGCTPGFWKNNPAAWITATQFIPGQCVEWQGQGCKQWNTGSGTKFIDVFGIPSVMDVVSGDGSVENPKSMLAVMLDHEEAGNIGTFENHLVAAVLNADASPEIYGTTVQSILEALAAMDAGQISFGDLFDTLVAMNEAGSCYLNANGFCSDGMVSNELGECIASCEGGQRYDYCTETCVPKGTETSLEELLAAGYDEGLGVWNACK